VELVHICFRLYQNQKNISKNKEIQTEFAQKLLTWHGTIERQLPWKVDRDPYKIWLSEIIMQQTRVAQGTPYYLKFVNAYPTITDLANAPEGDIMKLWQGLGYYSRARNLHHAAKTVRDDFNGMFPRAYQDVLNLKGVGKYTAAAIVSFAYGDEYPVVDGNVLRVFSRYYGISDGIDTTPVQKDIYQKANQHIQATDPAAFNQAIMDFGALHCKPKNPQCDSCNQSDRCVALANDLVSEIPFKSKKIKKTTRYFHYFIISEGAQIIIRHRTAKGIWQSLYDYPCLENSSDKVLQSAEIEDYLSALSISSITNIVYPSKKYKHVLTHQTIYAQFYVIDVDKIATIAKPCLKIDAHNQHVYALPVLISNYLKDQEEHLL